jgi:hypothetical protein
MSFVALLVVLLVLGVGLFLLKDKMEPRVMTMIVVVMGLGVVFWVLNATGVFDGGFKLK